MNCWMERVTDAIIWPYGEFEMGEEHFRKTQWAFCIGWRALRTTRELLKSQRYCQRILLVEVVQSRPCLAQSSIDKQKWR
ncbi:unnamed protein product [Calypogeia fissa]